MRAVWRGQARAEILADPTRRLRVLRDIFDALDDEILETSTLYRMILGKPPGADGVSADIIVDCVNTATAISYRNL